MTTSKDLGLSYARLAGADLSAALNKFAMLDANGNVVLATAAAKVLGTIIEENNINYPVTVQYGGQGKVIVGAGGAIAAGAQINSDASGLAATGATNSVGVALTGGAVGTVIEFAFV
jgi:hypothetical protein